MSGTVNTQPVQHLGTSVDGHLRPCEGPQNNPNKCVTSALHEGGSDSCRKALQQHDISGNEVRDIKEGQMMDWESFRNSSKHQALVLFSNVPHHRKEAWFCNVSPGGTGIKCYS